MAPRVGEQIQSFFKGKEEEKRRARIRAAFFLAFGVELDSVVSAGAVARARMLARLKRRMRRERLRGLSNRDGYDLDRQIALKHAIEVLQAR